MVKVVVDSVSDISPEIAREAGITVVPYRVHFGTEDFRDRIDISPAEFYSRLVKGPVLPTTASPTPGDFATAFDNLSAETNEIIVLTVSSKLTASYDSALKGKEQMKSGSCRVEVVDSLSAVMAQGLVALAAQEEAMSGKSLDEVTASVRRTLPKAYFLSCFDTLEYMRRGGRVGRAKALMASMLHVNPIITLANGEVEPAGRERSRAKAIEHLYNFVKGHEGKIRKLAVEYADYGNTPAEARALAARLQPLLPQGERVYMSTVSPVIGTHTGPGNLIVSVLEA